MKAVHTAGVGRSSPRGDRTNPRLLSGRPKWAGAPAMYDQVLDHFRNAAESILQFLQELLRNWTRQWPQLFGVPTLRGHPTLPGLVFRARSVRPSPRNTGRARRVTTELESSSPRAPSPGEGRGNDPGHRTRHDCGRQVLHPLLRVGDDDSDVRHADSSDLEWLHRRRGLDVPSDPRRRARPAPVRRGDRPAARPGASGRAGPRGDHPGARPALCRPPRTCDRASSTSRSGRRPDRHDRIALRGSQEQADGFHRHHHGTRPGAGRGRGEPAAACRAVACAAVLAVVSMLGLLGPAAGPRPTSRTG